MSLTLGTGPFAARRRGTFNFDIAGAAYGMQALGGVNTNPTL